jgi:hypothetical protein
MTFPSPFSDRVDQDPRGLRIKILTNVENLHEVMSRPSCPDQSGDQPHRAGQQED